MADGLKIRGITYRSFEEVESAVRELAAAFILLPEESDDVAPMVNHILDLLEALPDDRASALNELLAPIGGDGEAATVEPSSPETIDPQPGVLEIPEGHAVGRDGTIGVICPMCRANGVLEVEPPQDPTAETCPGCNGHGRVATGSRVIDKATRACPICGGDGFVAKPPNVELPAPSIRAADVPEWPGAIWNTGTLRWTAPPDSKPWPEAEWNDIAGRWQ